MFEAFGIENNGDNLGANAETNTEAPLDDREATQNRIEFELRRIAQELSDGSGIQSLADAGEVARLSDAIDYVTITNLEGILDDNHVTPEEIRQYLGDNVHRLNDTLNDLRELGNQLRLSDHMELRAMAAIDEASAVLDQSSYSDLAGRLDSMGESTRNLASANENMQAIEAATVERYSDEDGPENFATDQENLQTAETEYFLAQQKLFTAFSTPDSNSTLSAEYTQVNEQIANYGEMLSSIGLINVGNRNIVRQTQEQQQRLIERKNVIEEALHRFNRGEGAALREASERAREKIIAARNNISRVFDQRINNQIDANFTTIEEARANARAQITASEQSFEEQFRLTQDRLREEQLSLRDQLATAQIERQQIQQSGQEVETQATQAREQLEVSRRTRISGIVNVCELHNIGENQLRSILEGNNHRFSLDDTTQRELFAQMRLKSIAPDSQAELDDNTRWGLTEALRQLSGLSNADNAVASQRELMASGRAELQANLSVEEVQLNERLTAVGTALVNLESSGNTVRSTLQAQLAEAETQLSALSLNLNESMGMLYETQGLNDLANESFAKTSQEFADITPTIFENTATMESSLREYQVPDLPGMFIRGVRTVFTPTRLALTGIDHLAGGVVNSVGALTTLASHSIASVFGASNLTLTEAMSDYDTYQEYFSTSLTEHMVTGSQTLYGYSNYIFENAPAILRPLQVPISGAAAVIGGLGAFGQILISPDKLFSGLYKLSADFPNGLYDFGRCVIHANEFNNGDYFGWAGAVAGEALVIIAGPSAVGLSAKAASSLASTVPRVTNAIGRLSNGSCRLASGVSNLATNTSRVITPISRALSSSSKVQSATNAVSRAKVDSLAEADVIFSGTSTDRLASSPNTPITPRILPIASSAIVNNQKVSEQEQQEREDLEADLERALEEIDA